MKRGTDARARNKPRFWVKLAEKHLFSQENQGLRLAGRIQNARKYAKRDSEIEPEELPLYAKDAKKLDREMRKAVSQAILDPDSAFPRRFSDACALVNSGKKISKGLDATGAAVYAYMELLKEGRREPTWPEVQERVKLWWKEGYNPPKDITPEHWNRVFCEMAPLFE